MSGYYSMLKFPENNKLLFWKILKQIYSVPEQVVLLPEQEIVRLETVTGHRVLYMSLICWLVD